MFVQKLWPRKTMLFDMTDPCHRRQAFKPKTAIGTFWEATAERVLLFRHLHLGDPWRIVGELYGTIRSDNAFYNLSNAVILP